jgi:hypothetical protein
VRLRFGGGSANIPNPQLIETDATNDEFDAEVLAGERGEATSLKSRKKDFKTSLTRREKLIESPLPSERNDDTKVASETRVQQVKKTRGRPQGSLRVLQDL